MNTLLLIHSYPGANDTLRMLWSGFKSTGYDIVGVECIDDGHEWPEPVWTIKIGRNIKWQADRRNLPTRLISSLRYFLLTPCESCCLAEYDVAFLGKPPEFTGGIMACLAGGQLPDSKASFFLHFPMWFDRDSAQKVIDGGLQLMGEGACEYGSHGSPDVFLALILERFGIPWTPSGTFTANTIEGVFVERARQAYRDGVRVFHGVKTQAHLDSIVA